MRLAYYPGCVSRSTGKEMDRSTRAVCVALGIELEELPDWSCCGATHVPNEFVSTGLAARNIIQTELPIMTAMLNLLQQPEKRSAADGGAGGPV